MTYIKCEFELTEEDVEDILSPLPKLNWTGKREMFKTWAIGPPIMNAYSTEEEKDDAFCLLLYLQSDPTLHRDYEIERCSHPRYEWVDHLSFRAIDSNREPTRIFRIIAEWYEMEEGNKKEP